MSKGNMFLGYARGKVGSVVFSRLYGEQITRAYNARPANPKSTAQATQRMFFASIAQYYRSYRYLIEQGQQGVQVGQKSVQAWQSKTLKQLASVMGSTPMLTNAKGVQAPQLLPISLTDGTLPAIDYSIVTTEGSGGDKYHAIKLPFRNNYTTAAGLAAMTLGDFYALYSGIKKGAQLTFVGLAWSLLYDMFDLGNRAFQPIWCQFVLSPDADETLPFFVANPDVQGRYIINPEILQMSWGERFEPEITIEEADGLAYARVFESDFNTDGGGGIYAGAVITSYYDGSQWARSNSPFAIADGYGRLDLYDIIATYQAAAKSASSDLYLNQSKATADGYDSVNAPSSLILTAGDRVVDLTDIQGATLTVDSLTVITVDAAYRVDIAEIPVQSLIKSTITGTFTSISTQRTKTGNTVRLTLTPSTTSSDGQYTDIALTLYDGTKRTIRLNWQE